MGLWCPLNHQSSVTNIPQGTPHVAGKKKKSIFKPFFHIIAMSKF